MDWSKVPWEQGLGSVFGLILLKMLYDLVYKIMPRGMRLLRRGIIRMRVDLSKRLDEQTEALDLLREEVINLEDLMNEQAEAKLHKKPLAERPRRRRRSAAPPGGPGVT